MSTRQEAAGDGQTRLADIYEFLVGDEDARVCKDIPESACDEQPRNFLVSVVSYSATKLGDQLASASLVLPWLLSAMGAPAYLTGVLVPVREAGALVPQLFVAGFVRPFPIRKWFWVGGSVGQAVCLFGMVMAALTLQGMVGGLSVVLLLALFSLARGVSSVASKDVIGKTISKRRRGTMMGYASALAGLAAAAAGLWFSFESPARADGTAALAMLGAAGLLWLIGAGAYALVAEAPGATAGGGNAITEGLRSMRLLQTDRSFRDFVITRALMLGIALSLPFYALLAREQTGGDQAGLGMMLVASGLAGSLSAPVWGRMADRSSRHVMMIAAAITAALGLVVFAAVRIGAGVMDMPMTYALLFFVLGIAHSGARLGRKTHLIDMASGDKRAAYVAVSNTVIGILIFAGAGFGVVAEVVGTAYAILMLAMLAAIAMTRAARLESVQ